MKDLFKKWKNFTLLESVDLSGDVSLFHFSSADQESLMLDPEYFLKQRQHYSRNDYNVSDMPRIFFYTDRDQAEAQVAQGATLYSAVVPGSQIYNLAQDPLDLKQKSASVYRVTPDYDRILRSLGNRPRQSEYGAPPESLLSNAASHFKGAYYNTSGLNIVVWFEPINVTRRQDES
jgi:hypothetical protein